MRKGVTPVVAVIMLIAITVGAGGTLWTVYQDYMPDENPQTSIVDVTNLDIESCWHQGSDTYLSIRNENTRSINASKVNVFINGSLQGPGDYQYNRQIVEPQQTFRLEIYQDLTPAELIMLSTGSSRIQYRC